MKSCRCNFGHRYLHILESTDNTEEDFLQYSALSMVRKYKCKNYLLYYMTSPLVSGASLGLTDDVCEIREREQFVNTPS